MLNPTRASGAARRTSKHSDFESSDSPGVDLTLRASWHGKGPARVEGPDYAPERRDSRVTSAPKTAAWVRRSMPNLARRFET